MKKNVGKMDKIVRLSLGLVIICVGIYFQSWWGALGAGIMLPALLGSDPLYSVIGVDTNK